MIEKLNVTVIQDEISWQAPAKNRVRYDEHFEKLDQQSNPTHLIVLPEMFSTGFYMEPWQCYETMDGETVEWMRQRSKSLNTVISGSLIMKVGDDYLNRMIWARPDGKLSWYDKRHLFRFGGEHHNYTGGNERIVLELHGWRLALFICYDLRFPVWSRNRDDYDVGIYVANWPNARQFAWDNLIKARAIENQVYVLGVNRTGNNPLGDEYSGGSVILDFMGKSIQSAEDKNLMLRANLSKQSLLEFREYFPAAMDSDESKLDNGLKITWLSSFPKSGNTYLRFLLYNYVFGAIQHSNELAKRIPDLHRLITNKQTLNVEKNRRMFVKTHYPISQSHPYFEHTERYIYIIRNPLDTMLSNARFFGCGFDEPDKLKAFIKHYIQRTTTQRWINLGYGTWPAHIGAWVGAVSHYPACLIRYEDLRLEPAKTLKHVVRFLNLQLDEDKIQLAVSNSSIDTLRKMEDNEGTSGIFTTATHDKRFVNEGNTGQKISDIDPSLQADFDKRFGDLMNLYGY